MTNEIHNNTNNNNTGIRIGIGTGTGAASIHSATTATATASAKASAHRQLMRRVLIEFLIVVTLVVAICIFEFALEPARRGFFCDDESISYPYRPNTITEVMLGLLVGLLPLLIIIVVEYVKSLRTDALNSTRQLLGWEIRAWYVELFRQCNYFFFGMLLTFDATEVGKYTIGRLRPHFLAVCQPQLTDGTMCSDVINRHRYVENYECIGEGFTADNIRQSRLSFPSGHSSLAFYAMVYMVLYLQHSLAWRSSKLCRHCAQFVLIMLAWFTALSRVMDNWHHWSDVLVGSLIGVIAALITALYITKFFSDRHQRLSAGGNLQREDTSATLQEVCPSTPPPYCVNGSGSFHDDQYCTKV